MEEVALKLFFKSCGRLYVGPLRAASDTKNAISNLLITRLFHAQFLLWLAASEDADMNFNMDDTDRSHEKPVNRAIQVETFLCLLKCPYNLNVFVVMSGRGVKEAK